MSESGNATLEVSLDTQSKYHGYSMEGGGSHWLNIFENLHLKKVRYKPLLPPPWLC